MKNKKICALVLVTAFVTGILGAGCNKEKETSATGTSDTGISISIDPNVTSPTNGTSSGSGSSDASGASDSTATTTLMKMSYTDNYDEAAIKEMGKKVTIHGMEIPELVYNFYFANEYAQMLSSMMYGTQYPMTPNGFLDLEGKIKVQKNGEPVEKTIREYLNDTVLSDLQGEVWLTEYANKKGITLDDTAMQDIDKQITDAQASAEKYNMTLEEYMQSYYGPAATTDGMRDVLRRYELINKALQDYIASYQLSDADKMIPKVYHVLYATMDLSTRTALSEEQKQAAKTKAEALKNEISSFDDIKTKGEAAVTAGEAAEAHEYTVMRGVMVKPFEEWCYASHKDGDKDIVETEFGYHVMFFEGMVEASEEEKKNIAGMKMQDEMDAAFASGEYDPTYK